MAYLDALVCVSDDTNKQTEHNEDEQRNEAVEVEAAEIPDQLTGIIYQQERVVHIITVYQSKQTF